MGGGGESKREGDIRKGDNRGVYCITGGGHKKGDNRGIYSIRGREHKKEIYTVLGGGVIRKGGRGA